MFITRQTEFAMVSGFKPPRSEEGGDKSPEQVLGRQP